MIRQLRKRFILIAVVALTIAMLLVVGVVNLTNWINVRGELFDTLNQLALRPAEGTETASFSRIGTDTLSGSEDTVPPTPPGEGDASSGQEDAAPPTPRGEEDRVPMITDPSGRRPDRQFIPSRQIRNLVAESKWMYGVVTAEGEIRNIRMDWGEEMDTETARALIRQAAESGREKGRIQDYLYQCDARPDGGVQVTFLNCETRLTTVRSLMVFSAFACGGGILLAWLLMTLLSRRAVEPTIRNMEQQKQFITNASHELKTPLTVISTNMELLEMENEGNPWVRSTQKQTAAMRKLVDELVYLSRMEEEHPTLEMEPLDPGALLEETAEPFEAMAEYSGREMRVTAEKGLHMTGDRASIQRLFSTLCDNAVKYASGGPIIADLRGEGKHIVLRVSNPVEEPLTKQQCEQLFNRFYRADLSRSKEKQSGFGIGLAIAAAIAEKHGGRISAAMDGDRLVFTCWL